LETPQRAVWRESFHALISNLIQPPDVKERSTISFKRSGFIEPFVSQQIRRILPFALSMAFLETWME
jgi:hypothetical protein